VLVEQLGTAKHYIVKDWPAREDYSWKSAPLVNPKWMLLPPLHVKLGLMKNFVKALDNSGEGFH